MCILPQLPMIATTQSSNQAMERTATRRAFTSRVDWTPSLWPTRAPGGRRSARSRYMVNPARRQLTPGEVRILAIIEEHFGARNTPDEVFFTDADEAALFIKAPDGTIPTDDQLKSEWLPTI
jgi:hypothetical protein